MTALFTWRNLWRNPRRTIITLVSVTFAVLFAVLMQSFQKGVFDNLVNNVVGYYYGYIQVHKKGYWDERNLDNGFNAEASLLNRYTNNLHIREVVPRLETFILASAGNVTKGCFLAGTDTGKEDNFSGLENKVIAGKYFQHNEPAALLAEGLARRLNLRVNDTVILLGQGYQGTLAAGKFPVKGILHFGSPELNNRMLYLPLPVAQELLNAGPLLTSIAFSINQPAHTELIRNEIASVSGEEYEVMTWQELMPEIASHIRADTASFYIFNGILYLIVSFGIFGTILMMTTERRYEFGMLVAIGMKKTRLGLMLFTETILITVLGVALGLLCSYPLVWYFNRHPIRIGGEVAAVYERFGFEAVFPAAMHPPVFFTQSLIILGIAFIIGLYPLWHIRNLKPVKAMRK